MNQNFCPARLEMVMRSCRVVSVNWPDGSGHSFNDTPGVGGSMASVNIYLNIGNF